MRFIFTEWLELKFSTEIKDSYLSVVSISDIQQLESSDWVNPSIIDFSSFPNISWDVVSDSWRDLINSYPDSIFIHNPDSILTFKSWLNSISPDLIPFYSDNIDSISTSVLDKPLSWVKLLTDFYPDMNSFDFNKLNTLWIQTLDLYPSNIPFGFDLSDSSYFSKVPFFKSTLTGKIYPSLDDLNSDVQSLLDDLFSKYPRKRVDAILDSPDFTNSYENIFLFKSDFSPDLFNSISELDSFIDDSIKSDIDSFKNSLSTY
jgi:hypothetical protein